MLALPPILRTVVAAVPWAILALIGVVVAWRSTRWFLRLGNGRCTRCGHRVRGGEWTTDVCSECGTQVGTPTTMHRIARGALVAAGVCAQVPLLIALLRFHGAGTAVFLAGVALVGAAAFVEMLLELRTARRRSFRRLACVAVLALALQAPWGYVVFRFLRMESLEERAMWWNAQVGLSGFVDRPANRSTIHLLAWLPGRWVDATNGVGVQVSILGPKAFATLEVADVRDVTGIRWSTTIETSPPVDELQLLARFSDLRSVTLPVLQANTERRAALATLPDGCELFAPLVDAKGEWLGWGRAVVDRDAEEPLAFTIVSRLNPPAAVVQRTR
jgi:hypothetical protein